MIRTVLVLLFLGTIIFALANPSTVYCNAMDEEFGGYEYAQAVDENLDEYGICIMPDGTECDAWDFLKGSCGEEFSYCEKEGYGTANGTECIVPSPSGRISLSVIDMMNLSDELGGPLYDSNESGYSAMTSGGYQSFDSVYNASDFSYWDWRSPPAGTIYAGENYVYFDETNGWLTSVKDQRSCGSCWAFSTLGSMEATYNLEMNESRLDPDLSEQYEVSCDHNCIWIFCQNGCNGGWMDVAFDNIIDNGVADESCFPYVAIDRSCSRRCSDYSSRRWYVGDYQAYSLYYGDTLSNDQIEQMLIDHGPLSIAVEASEWSLYDSGVSTCTVQSAWNDLNHGVVLVGYNDTGSDSTSYWIIKNSWGERWGEDGYIKTKFGCYGVGFHVSYPEGISPPNYKPTIATNSDENCYSNPCTFNFTVQTRVSSTATCDLIIDNETVNTTTANDDVPTILAYSLPNDVESTWVVRCWETNMGINTETAPQTMTYHRAPRNIQIIPPTLENNSYTNKNWVYVNATFDYSVEPDSCWLTWNSGIMTNISMNRIGNNCYRNVTEQTDGVKAYSIHVNNTQGDVGSNGTFYLTVDTTVPADIEFSSPTLDNNSYTNKNWFYVNMTFTETNPDGCSIEIDGSNLSMTRMGNTCYINLTGQHEGEMDYLVHVTDVAGNVGTSMSRHLTIDWTNPTITLTNRTIAHGEQVRLQLNASDESGIASWTVNDSNFAINNSGYLVNSVPLSDGVHWLRVGTRDSAGNVGYGTMWVEVTPLPSIESYSVTPRAAVNGSSIQLFISAENADDLWAEITLPNSNVETISLVNNDNTSYSNTNLMGRYQVEFHVNDSFGNNASEEDYFETHHSVLFHMLVVDSENEGVDSTVKIGFENGTIIESESNNGTYSEELPEIQVYVEIRAYSEGIIVRLNGINTSVYDDETIGIGRQTGNDRLVVYGIETNYTFANATVNISYNGTGYTNENYLALYKCNDWNFDNQTCAGNWTEITQNATKNTIRKYFSYLTTTFSGFAIDQESYCGDDTCDDDESCSSCSADCSCTGGGGGSSGGGGGGGGGSGGSNSAKRNATLYHEEEQTPQCLNDSACSDDEICLGSQCIKITGYCGFPENHSWTYYQCCSDDMCDNQTCINHSCVGVTEVENKTTNYEFEVPCKECNETAPNYDLLVDGLLIIGGVSLVIVLMRRSKLVFAVLILGIMIQLVHAEMYNHSITSSSYAKSTENITTYKFKIMNEYTTPTLPFRIFLSSNFTWFDPHNFTYTVAPDGIEGNSLYWDMPKVMQNESMELSFIVNGIVGLPEEIEIETETIDRWTDSCTLIPYSNYSESAGMITRFVTSLNQSQNITVYYEENWTNGKNALVHLDGYNVFAVFKIENETVSAISNETEIEEFVEKYIETIGPANTTPDLSKIYLNLTDTRSLKSKAEEECYLLTGMSRFPCVDRESCLYSCFSVPVCSQIGQSGWVFMDTIMRYNQSIDKTNRVLDESIGVLETFSKYPSYENAEKAYDKLIELNRAETAVIYHPMFTSYGFCPPPEYGILQQINIRREMLNYMEANCVQGEKNRIVNESILVARILKPAPI